MRILRFIVKIIAAPFVVALAILAPVILFLFAYTKLFMQILSGISVLLSIVFFIAKNTPSGIFFLVAGFLLSPVGLPAIGEWLVVKLHVANHSLREFMTS